ncbi:alpha/beta hydrolase [Mycobacterium sp. Root265]|uniref:alpha/beta fold hydrolase n=1 Tax=Mycobacterium sp. Root265 TaxID=1736504 RepID=UPI00070DD040|nr:alpha/beta fold hydrolase [Mycobacterium sp. Root265]KRD06679.1 alpha/beta hydrolase [Mycobacterium sp. Root265]
MTVVFVHGNPETSAIWGPLIQALNRDDIVTLSPPGFGAPLPAGFDPTYLAYRDWLEDELQQIDGPVDLVGHDWGGGHVVNVVMHRPELVRSWVSDIVGVFDPEYVWHDLAQIWQTPDAGEEYVAAMISGISEERIAAVAAMGVGPEVAPALVAAQNADMGAAMLRLYRSAAQPVLAEAGVALGNAAARPGLAILATEDHFVGSAEIRRRAADRAGARTEVLDGLGHWWMIEDPARGAEVLTRFWAAL